MTALRLTEEEFAALSGKGGASNKAPNKNQKVVIAGGYKSNLQGWRTIGGKTYYFRSLWEMNFARYLEWLKRTGQLKDWWYEPELFEFPRNAHKGPPFQYLPDFKARHINNSVERFEVKGYMNASSKRKIKRFNKHFPSLKLTVVGKKWFHSVGRKHAKLIPGWETLSNNLGPGTPPPEKAIFS